MSLSKRIFFKKFEKISYQHCYFLELENVLRLIPKLSTRNFMYDGSINTIPHAKSPFWDIIQRFSKNVA